MAAHRIRLLARLATAFTALAVSGLVLLGSPASAEAAPQSGTATQSQVSTGLPRFGQSGDAVRALQQALVAKGFTLVGGVDGVFSPRTRATLRSFQQVVGFRPTGRLDRRTAQLLGLTSVSTTSTPVGVTAPTTAVPTPSITWTLEMLPVLGGRGEAVVALQNALIASGAQVFGGADGIFGQATRNALRAFQKSKNLPTTGRLDEATAIELGLLPRPAPVATPPVAAAQAPTAISWSVETFPVLGARGETVTAIQNALIASGTQVFGGADGIFGQATRSALRAFQKSKNLPTTGLVDEPTMVELGLIPRPVLPVSISVFPVRPACFFADTWMAPRGPDRKHEGVDIIANRGQEVLAVADGTITKIYTVDTARLSGNAIRLTTADKTYFFYAHLDSFAPGITVGTKVTAGQVIGTVGSTGATTPHLHFEVHPLGGAAVNPYPIVKAVDACKK